MNMSIHLMMLVYEPVHNIQKCRVYCLQEIIVIANSATEALQIGVKEFELPEKELDFYNLTDYANSQVKPQTLVHYNW